MNDYSRYSSPLALIDMLMGMLAVFVALFIVVSLQVQPIHKQSVAALKAEFVITMTWPNTNFDDVDLHLLLPDNNELNFNNKDSSYATLDRDDRGATTDVITEPDGTQKMTYDRREIITIRAIVPGTYAVDVHLYAIYDEYMVNGVMLYSNPKTPYPVHVVLEKLNPEIKKIVSTDVIIDHMDQVKTAFIFTVTPEGKVINVDTNADVPLKR